MSVNLSYKVVKRGKSLPGTSITVRALSNAFGPLPVVIGIEDLDTLKGMKAIDENTKTYPILIKAIESFGKIQIYAKY